MPAAAAVSSAVHGGADGVMPASATSRYGKSIRAVHWLTTEVHWLTTEVRTSLRHADTSGGAILASVELTHLLRRVPTIAAAFADGRVTRVVVWVNEIVINRQSPDWLRAPNRACRKPDAEGLDC